MICELMGFEAQTEENFKYMQIKADFQVGAKEEKLNIK